MGIFKKPLVAAYAVITAVFLSNVPVWASEADLKIPAIEGDHKKYLLLGLVICILGLGFGLVEFIRVKKLRAHKSMIEMGETIFSSVLTTDQPAISGVAL